MGVYLLADVLDGNRAKPFISLYLLFLGLSILYRASRGPSERSSERALFLSGFGMVRGFCDAIGGGGWGPIVTSTLVARGNHPRYVIGSVNTTEFFVTTAQSVTFFLTVQQVDWRIIYGMVAGGVIAAPFAAYSVRRIDARALMILVGCLVVDLNLRTIIPYILRAF